MPAGHKSSRSEDFACQAGAGVRLRWLVRAKPDIVPLKINSYNKPCTGNQSPDARFFTPLFEPRKGSS